MSADNSSTYRTASKPPPILWANFATHLQGFISLPAEEKLSAVSAVADELSPFVHWAVFDLAQRHTLLIDAPDSHRLLFSHVIGLKRAPANMELFILGLQSVALKKVVAERAALTSSLTCAQPAWTGFRNRFNSLECADRALLLDTLPQTSQTAVTAQTRTLPNSQSIKLWHEVASGVPQQALPVEWQRFACEHAPKEVQRIEDLLKPSAESSFALPNIILSRESSAKTVKKLGRWLFRAAATQEQRLGDSSVVELQLPAWVAPKSTGQFGQELHDIIRANDGVPGDSGLQSVLEESLDSLESGIWLPASLESSKLLLPLQDLGVWRFETSTLQGVHLRRKGLLEEARLAHARQLNIATTPKEVATALANLAGIHLHIGNLAESESLLREALRLNPWSKLAMTQLALLNEAGARPSTGESHAQ